jgi:hypothetical protein
MATANAIAATTPFGSTPPRRRSEAVSR